MYLLKYLNFPKGVLKHYVIYTILWMGSYTKSTRSEIRVCVCVCLCASEFWAYWLFTGHVISQWKGGGVASMNKILSKNPQGIWWNFILWSID